MEYRRLGKTSERVSVIGMGTWEIGFTANPLERREQIQALRRGIELGINLIDTAEMYGDGKSEQLVGEVIQGNRDSIFIATKVWQDNLHHDDVIAACDRSLQRLGVRYIDLYQVHWPNSQVPIRETMNAMERLVRDGKVRYIGVSNFSVDETRNAQASLTKSEVVSNQVEYSLISRAIEANLLPYCEREGITVIAYSPLARGNLPEAQISRAILEKHHMTLAQLMLNWVTRREGVVAIPKSASIRHIEENANSVNVRLTQDEYDLVSLAF